MHWSSPGRGVAFRVRLHDDSPARLGIWDAAASAGEPWTGSIPPVGGRAGGSAVAAAARRARPRGALERLSATVESDPGWPHLPLPTRRSASAFVAACGASRPCRRASGLIPTGSPGWTTAILAFDSRSRLRKGPPSFGFARRSALRIAVEDLCGRLEMPEVGRRLAEVADTAAEAALTWSKTASALRPRFESWAMSASPSWPWEMGRRRAQLLVRHRLSFRLRRDAAT